MACIIVWDPVAQSLSVMGERNPWDRESLGLQLFLCLRITISILSMMFLKPDLSLIIQ